MHCSLRPEPSTYGFTNSAGREIRFKKLDVSDVEKLELITEDAGDGWANDWGLWLDPQLVR